MNKTLDDVTARILGDVLASVDLEPLGVPEDFGGDEFPCSAYAGKTRVVRSPLMADVPGADTTNWSSDPRPTITAWRGADIANAYYFDADRGVWLHCLDGTEWTP